MNAYFLDLALLLWARLAAGAGEALKALYDAHEWFRLRDAVAAKVKPPALYRGAAAYAFGDFHRAEAELRRVIAAAPSSEDAIEAHGILIYLAQMQGKYPRALAEIRAIQAARPGIQGLENGAASFTLLSALPGQRVLRRRPASLRFSMIEGNLFIPVTVNGVQANFLFDTGANFSLISESEARRLGMEIRDAPGAHSDDVAGTKMPLRLALAARIRAGGFELENVPFQVVRDDQQPFASLPAGSRGVLGIPLALAFQTVRWHAGGRFEIGARLPRTPASAANLCLDTANPLIAAEYAGKPVTVFLDTGATLTRLMPAFARDFPDALRNAARGVATVRGVGGKTEKPKAELRGFRLRIGGGEAALEQNRGAARGYPGPRRPRSRLGGPRPVLGRPRGESRFPFHAFPSRIGRAPACYHESYMSGRRGTRLLLLAAITVIVLAVGGAYRFQKILLQKQAPHRPAALPQRLNATAQDWEFTNSREGKLVVSVRAKDFRQVKATGIVELDTVELKLHRKQGGRYDLVRSAKAEFRTTDKILYSEGEVEITLAVPEEPDEDAGNRLVSIRSSGVSFDTGTGRATTDRAASFRFEHGEGKCVGAFYDPSTREAAMHDQVEIDWKPPNGGKPLKIEAGQSIYKEGSNVIFLFPWSRLTQEGGRIDAGDTFVTLEKGAIRKSESKPGQGLRRISQAAPPIQRRTSVGGVWQIGCDRARRGRAESGTDVDHTRRADARHNQPRRSELRHHGEGQSHEERAGARRE